MIQHKDSHLDHGLSPAVVDYVMRAFAERDAFFIQTFTLPPGLGTVPCGLYGPLMGDSPITDDVCPFGQAFHEKRGERAYTSRVIRTGARQVRTVTVIAGPHNGLPCVLYTAFGGPLTPKEPNDPTLDPEKRAESEKFWSEHALAL